MNTREQIIKAAGRVMRTKGLARSTTKEIARAAGVSEGSLYNHFESKEDLFISVLSGLPGFLSLVMTPPERAGSGTVQGNLEEVARAALDFYNQSVPMAASIFSEPQLLARHREGVLKRNSGPQKVNEALEAYLRAEQSLGRVADDVKPRAVADLLLGACFQHAFFMQFLGKEVSEGEKEHFVRDTVQTLIQGIAANRRE